LPVHQDDGKNGPGLDGDVKHLGLGIVKPSRLPARIRWPVLEMGKNSVSPSTTPMMAALISNTMSMFNTQKIESTEFMRHVRAARARVDQA
jgi:hypothetical protein